METAITTTENAALYVPSSYTTFDIKASVEVKKMAANAVNAAESLAQFEGQTLNIIGIMTMPGTRRSRQQGVPDTPCTNTYLIAEDGKAYFSQSEGVRRAADSFESMALFGGEPVPMHLESKQLVNGNTIKTLVLE